MTGEPPIVSVLTAQPVGRALDYRAPPEGLRPGAFVTVPLGPRTVLGVVWGAGAGDYDAARVKPVTAVLDLPPMTEELRSFIDRAAAYTMTPPTAMLRLATRAPGLADPPGERMLYARGPGTPPRMTDARARVLDAAEAAGGPMLLGELASAAGASASVIKGLLACDAIVETRMPRDAAFPPLDPDLPGKALTQAQEKAANALAAKTGAGFGATLLQGVTGSGKTEVYLEAVAACLRAGRQALVLLPEIALTSGFLTRIAARFGARPAEWHSGVTQAERRRVWRMVATGGAEVVVGARSALFLPYRDLGLIVVDEEHDAAYKQEDGVLYNARDMAVLRAQGAGAQVVLATATPSLETWANATAGRYDHLRLSDRFGPAHLPQMRAIDMRRDGPERGRWISPPLARAVEARLAAGEQALLFLNRRGYAPVTLCRACGQQVGCHQCDARMVEHRFLKRLVCHQCGESRPIPETCPACGVEGQLFALGPGVERLAEEAAERFGSARIAVLSSDLFGSAADLKAQIAAIAEGGADIIIGTQLVAKGHNFPLLTLVGVIDADLALQGSDLRAAERTFQLIRQVSGRAGRADRPGTALIQTYQPDHGVIRAILGGDEDAFWRAEAEGRRAAGMPPYGRLAGIVMSGRDAGAVFDLGNHLARTDAPLRAIGAQVFGPAPAPIARVRGRHRVRLLVKAPKGAPLQAGLADWIAGVRLKGDLRLAIDIDPQSFL